MKKKQKSGTLVVLARYSHHFHPSYLQHCKIRSHCLASRILSLLETKHFLVYASKQACGETR